MENGQLRTLIHCLRRLAGPQQAGGLSDGQLLERFIGHQDEAAFEVLVWRHGPMVLNVCRRLLHHTQDAEDAFQATFLTFVRKAASIRRRETVSSWLYRVAYRVALRAKARSARQVRIEQQVIPEPVAEPVDEVVWRDLRPVLDEAINRLPDKFRTVIILCYLEGKTHREAAQLLGCPEGTIVSRLARARERLRTQLSRRGLTLATGGLGLLLCEKSIAAALPGTLVEATLKVGLLYAVGPENAAGAVSASVTALTEGVLRAMFLSKLTVVAAVVLVGCLVGAGIVGLSGQSLAAPQTESQTAGASGEPLAKPDGAVLRWKLQKAKPFFQEITTQTDQQMTVMGKDVAQKQTQTFFVRWTPKEQNRDGHWVITQRVEGVKIDMDIGGVPLHYDSTTGKASGDSPLADFYKAVVGSEFQLTVPFGPRGLKIEGVSEFFRKLSTSHTDLRTQTFADYNQMLGVWFIAVPDQPLQVGDTWTRTNGFSLYGLHGFKSIYQYTYVGKEGPLDKITVTATVQYQVVAPSKVEGFPVPIKKADLKTSKGTGVILFDRAKGRIVQSEMTLLLEGQLTMVLDGKESQVELKQTQKMRVRTTDANPLKRNGQNRDAEAEIQRLKQDNERLKRQLQAIEQALKKEPPPEKK